MTACLNFRRFLNLLILVSLALSAGGCGLVPDQDSGAGAEQLASKVDRLPAGEPGSGAVEDLAGGNTAFALDLYHQLEVEEGNLFYSPYSISLALAMTYAGARGETAEEMRSVLHFPEPAERVHTGFNTLDQYLEGLAEQELPEEAGEAFRLEIANQLWGQVDYAFQEDFLDTQARYYGAGMKLLNFIEGPEESRRTINQWVSEQTEEKIQDLIPRGGVGSMTRLVLTNAIYFNASWWEPFAEDRTRSGDFTTLEGEVIQVPMMSHGQAQSFRYSRGGNYQAVEMPYTGNTTSMLVIMPDQGSFREVEEALSPEYLAGILDGLEHSSVALTFPKFEFESEFSLADVLQEMGMPQAFDAGADFSGITGGKDLFISDVFHKAFVAVDEEGTEAAAATAVVMAETSMPADPVQMVVDRPFFFLIREHQTGSILFLGRMVSP
jgi:serpin B